ncbi:hypothetical protein CCACVL1_28292, partial [Corchorus capsularis]
IAPSPSPKAQATASRLPMNPSPETHPGIGCCVELKAIDFCSQNSNPTQRDLKLDTTANTRG